MPGRAEKGKPHDTPLLSTTPYSNLAAPHQAASILCPTPRSILNIGHTPDRCERP
ncbi:hypothetical protein At1D1609_11240 [Agrobacterium tumefaciens]|uniref:Uncharacterized protein n=1 Tax=Agrobacterium tumefaciens TaxID=358 RepID=A0A2L2LA18_AGRTU|nr:hypothetical protein At1D1609_11240 [Agrobacterium tumefaciens]